MSKLEIRQLNPNKTAFVYNRVDSIILDCPDDDCTDHRLITEMTHEEALNLSQALKGAVISAKRDEIEEIRG